MQYIYEIIINYKITYPVKFWIIILFLSLLFFILIELLYKRRLKKQKEIWKREQPYRKYFNRLNNSILINTKAYIAPQKEESDEYPYDNRNKIFLFASITLALFIAFIIQAPFKKTKTKIKKSSYTFGIDISQYQGKINWNKLNNSHHPIEFIFIRATMGIDGKDKQFQRNWLKAKKHNYIRGAYHYYRPSENSSKQFKNFASVVKLEKGDFIPILDIERPSKYGSVNLRRGVLNWLKLAQKKYGVKPMLYTGRTFYKVNLQGYFDKYPLWIASYSHKKRVENLDWDFHQFTEKVKIDGIVNTVDGNDFKGKLKDLKEMCIKK